MKVRFRSADNSRWVKEGTPGAIVYGIQEGQKFRKVDLETLEARSFRQKNNKPRAAYRENGKFLKKEAAELLMNTEQFKKVEAEKIKAFTEKAAEFKEFGKTIAFHNMAKTFKGAFTDVHGFKKLIINRKDPGTGDITETKEIKTLDGALYELAQRGYEGAKIASEANGDKKAGTPAGLFNIAISMSEPGVYLIETEF